MTFLKCSIGLFFLLVANCSQLFAQEALSEILFDLENHKSLKNGICGFSLVEMDSNEEIASLNGETSLIPASSLKLITSFAALEILGEDYRYTTRLAYDGDILSDGTLNGNIYIIGSGDPTLGSNRISGNMGFSSLIKRFSQEIQNKGITCIDGQIIADESIFESFPICPSWQWNDLGNYYATGSWGININENLYNIYFNRREKVGVVPNIRTHYPFVPNLKFSNEVVTDKPGTPDNAYIFGGPYEYFKRIVGTIPAGKGEFVIKGSIPDPPLFLAFHLSTQLNKEGISHSGFKTKYHPNKSDRLRKVFYELSSPPVIDIVKRLNFHSVNLYSESLLKTIGLELRKNGSGMSGISELKNYLKQRKFDVSSLYMEDGSGLSARNLISASLLAKLMAHYYELLGKDYVLDLIPQGGKEGTMRSLFRSGASKYKVWAKSGSMERVQSFTGFIEGASGKIYAFSFICNNFTIKNREMRKIMEAYIKRIHAVI